MVKTKEWFLIIIFVVVGLLLGEYTFKNRNENKYYLMLKEKVKHELG